MSQTFTVLAAMALVAGQEDGVEVGGGNNDKECLEDFCLENGYKSWRFAKQENR